MVLASEYIIQGIFMKTMIRVIFNTIKILVTYLLTITILRPFYDGKRDVEATFKMDKYK